MDLSWASTQSGADSRTTASTSAPATSHTLPAWSQQTTKTQTPSTAQIHMHGQLIGSFRGIKSGKCEHQSIFLSFYTQIKEKSCPAWPLHSSQQCHFPVLYPVTEVQQSFCVSVAIKPTVNLKKVHRHQTFMVEWDSLTNSLLLLWVRNEGPWLHLQLVCWTLRNNNMVTAATMLASIIFQKLNPGREKKCVCAEKLLSQLNKQEDKCE